MGFVCSAPEYEYKGWVFEIHAYMGPWPLKKNGDPRKRAGRKFYKMWEEFSTLTEDEQKSFRIGGGCRKF